MRSDSVDINTEAIIDEPTPHPPQYPCATFEANVFFTLIPSLNAR